MGETQNKHQRGRALTAKNRLTHCLLKRYKNCNNANGFLRGKKHGGETRFSLYVIRHLRNYFSYHIFVLFFSDFKGPICTLENVKNTHNFTIQR